MPAILAITNDTFIVFAANAFALLGLRPLFFLVADLVERLYYLKTALAALLIFIGAKLAAAEFVGKIGPEISLPVIAAILATGVARLAVAGPAVVQGADRNRTGVNGFAGRCVATPPRRRGRLRVPGRIPAPSCLGVAVRHQDGTVEAVIAELARVRHGVVTRRRLLAAGVTLAEVRSRLRSGSLLLEYPGVYRVGHQAPSREATYLAAVEACGVGALLCGRAAAHLHRLIRGPAPPPEVVARSERRIEGILTCRSRRFDPREATVMLGIPVTTVARTLVDLAAVLEAGSARPRLPRGGRAPRHDAG